MDKSPKEMQHDRQDVRVRDILRLRISIIDPSEKEAILDRIALERLTTGLDEAAIPLATGERETQAAVSPHSAALTSRLAAIEAKIDAVLMYLTEKDLEEKWGQPRQVNISAGGLLFSHPELLSTGTLLRLEIMLQTHPPRPIAIVAEVIRTGLLDQNWAQEHPHQIAVRFIDIDPEDRDRIIKRIFEIQRMFLRRAHEQQTLQQRGLDIEHAIKNMPD